MGSEMCIRDRSADDIRGLDHAVVAFSEKFRAQEKPLRAFLHKNMYHHYKVNRMMSQARRVVQDLFNLFNEEPNLLPDGLYELTQGSKNDVTARVVCDYIAGMTDSFAITEHRKLFQPTRYL